MTRLERDASSGTALQEISFWLNLENALNRIQRKRDSPEVNLTLDVLKAGKRFHATVSFDSDTGKMNNYNFNGTSACMYFLLISTLMYKLYMYPMFEYAELPHHLLSFDLIILLCLGFL